MLPPRLVPPLCLLWALLSGCAHGAKPAGEPGAEPAKESPPGEATVTGDDINRTPGQPIEEVLMSRFPGVVVTRAPDGSIAIRIRGFTSIRGGTDPLYVIDGVPIRPGPGGSLSGINPYDIESIEVLKDPAGTAMYGVRGANGVIVIKTKGPGQ
jgi:TonB-dependent SusC/RagA subfamily outer membrane receptor